MNFVCHFCPYFVTTRNLVDCALGNKTVHSIVSVTVITESVWQHLERAASVQWQAEDAYPCQNLIGRACAASVSFSYKVGSLEIFNWTARSKATRNVSPTLTTPKLESISNNFVKFTC